MKRTKYLRTMNSIVIVFLVNIHILSASENQFDFITRMENQFDNIGLEADIIYKGELWSILRGKHSDGAIYLDNFDLIFNFDLAKSIGLTGGTFSFHILGNHGFKPNDNFNSMHGLTNIAAPQLWKLYTFHYEQKLLEENLYILIGTYDYNSEFDSKPTAGLFINSSHGIGCDISQSGENGPSIFPSTSLGLRIKFLTSKEIYVQAVVLDGVPGTLHAETDRGILLQHHDGLLISSEVGIEQSDENLKFSAGIWYYTDEYDKFFTDIMNWGVYTFLDSKIFTEKSKDQGLSGYLRLGAADRNTNEIGYFLAGGLVYTGIISGMDKDKLGLAFATAFSSDYALFKDNNGQCDIGIELTYQLNIFDSVSVQPNIQYFLYSENNEIIDNYIAAGIRLQINFI